MRRLFVSFLLLVLLGSLGTVGARAQTSPGPVIPKAVGDPHPEGNEFWRINHMDLLQHDRDATMYLGNREVAASLKECVACHAVNDEQGEPVGFDDSQHICRTCHDYTAVKIDCFSCHQSKPDADVLARLIEGAPVNVSLIDSVADMQNYVTSLQESGEATQ